MFLDNAAKKLLVSKTIHAIKEHDRYHGQDVEFGDAVRNLVDRYDWSEYDARHDFDSLERSARAICSLPEIYAVKVGVAMCPLWRTLLCDNEGPNGSMTSHFPTYNDIFVLALEYCNLCGVMEEHLIASIRGWTDRKVAVMNIKDGNDGTIREFAPTYLYVVCKRDLNWD